MHNINPTLLTGANRDSVLENTEVWIIHRLTGADNESTVPTMESHPD